MLKMNVELVPVKGRFESNRAKPKKIPRKDDTLVEFSAELDFLPEAGIAKSDVSRMRGTGDATW
jgi:hypothetical protein